MKTNLTYVGNTALLELEGEVDAEHAAQLKRVFVKLREEDRRRVVLDLQKVSFVDSTGLGILISLMRQLKEVDGELRLVGLQPEVRSIFEITRLYKVFELRSSIEDALRDLNK